MGRVTRVSCSTTYGVAMTNLTISVDADVLKRARIRALERDESVNAWLARQLEDYANGSIHAPAAAFLDFARTTTASSGPQGRTWTRDDAYDA